MNKLLLSVAAAAIALSSGGFGTRAAAVPLAAPLSVAPAAVVEQASNVCGSGGCFTVQTKRVTHPKPLHSSTSAPTH